MKKDLEGLVKNRIISDNEGFVLNPHAPCSAPRSMKKDSRGQGVKDRRAE